MRTSNRTPEEKRQALVQKVVRWRQNTKRKLVAYKGGKCEICGYNHCIANLIFHHNDPEEKDFGISGRTMAFSKMKKEADKCHLLCCRCHGEVHAGLISFPLSTTGRAESC